MEGIAIKWIIEYHELKNKNIKNLYISSNSIDLHEDLIKTMKIDSIYLPNIYMPVHVQEEENVEYDTDYREKCSSNPYVNIGCFGAIRPLKNHLIQAMAAIRFAEKIQKSLRFHINSNRIEQRGESILHNLRSLFSGNKNELIEHPWISHDKFIALVKTMDMGMQVSFSESFNIIAADFVSNNVPIVVSPDVTWMPSSTKADPNSTEDIVNKLKRAWKGGSFFSDKYTNIRALEKHNRNALDAWKEFVI
jgi:hypothetical protein